MTPKKIVIMDGDGIGPEVNRQAVAVLKAMADKVGLKLSLEPVLVGGAAIDQAGSALPEESLKKAQASDAVLLGAVGGPKWDKLELSQRPERGILKTRSELALFANLRPAKIYGDLVDASTLKREVVQGTDLMVIRELTGDIYYGQPRGISGAKGQRKALNSMVYSEHEIERIVRMGFEIARKRRKKLCSVDKSNVLEVSVLWREISSAMAAQYPEVELSHMLVDNAAMQLVRAPRSFDTIVTGNMFGDILSDEASMLTGSIGMLPSASLGERYALYEPIHGSAPDIAGKDLANPLAAILSVGMMFRYTFNMPEAEIQIENAVERALSKYRTGDILTPGATRVGTQQMGEQVLAELAALPRPLAPTPMA
ncbi:MAG: 3-isopropylmalate dehydrogenase [Deltaproteobacteria bacterium]|nr:3-isopropylmalate dehydrogenase [Deltaproteobacteria bacterium]